jgi:hypothetical protein
MFSTLRIAVVVGVIYYLSPVRHEDAKAGVEHVVAWGKGLILPSREPTREMGSAERLEALWKALPEEAKQAALERVLAEAGKQVPHGPIKSLRYEPPAPPEPPETRKPRS